MKLFDSGSEMRSTGSAAALATLLALVLLAVGAGAPLLAQGGADAVKIETTKLADGLYMMVGRGGNLGLSVGEDGAFLIDDQYAPLTEKIRAAAAEVGAKDIRFVLNTHWHGDHTGGNEKLGSAGTLIVAHDRVRQRLKAGGFIEFFNNNVDPAPKAALPVVTFDQTVTFHLNGEEIHAFHVPPAHTDGDSIVHFRKANVLHMGDLFFNEMYPFIDLSSGGSVEGVILAVERALALADDQTKIIPGHGPLATKADLQSYLSMLTGIRDAVNKILVSGRGEQAAISAKPTEPWDEAWGQGFIKPDQFVGIVYKSLAAN